MYLADSPFLQQRKPFLGGGFAQLKAFVRAQSPAAWFQFNTGITVTGQGVSQWDDQSGNGRHLKQGTDGARPALQADGSILFNGTDEYLKCDAFTLVQPETVYILGTHVTWTGASQGHWCDGEANNSMAIWDEGTTPEIDAFAGSRVGRNANLAVDTYGVVVAVFNGASSVLQVNNTTPVAGDCGAADAGGFTLGASGNGGAPSNIQAKESIIFPAAHGAATRARIIRYLSVVGQLGV